MTVDGEPIEVPVVSLEGMNRRKLSDFFRDAIVEESDEMLNRFNGLQSKEEYRDATCKLLVLQNLRKQVENEQFKYLQRF